MRTLLLIIVVAVVVYLGTSYYNTGHLPTSFRPEHSAVGTTGQGGGGPVDVGKARERGAEIGQDLGQAADRAGQFMSDASLTTKIKTKMALDDTIDARDIHVTTDHGVVTLTGQVGSSSQHQRAVQLTRETKGVTRVNDELRGR